MLCNSIYSFSFFLKCKSQSCISPKKKFQEKKSNKTSTKNNNSYNEIKNFQINYCKNSSNLKIPATGQGLLIVTFKSRVEEWAEIIRNLPEPRLFLYTDTLAKRRKFGVYNLAQYDVVITTFDVSKWKITLVSIPK